MAAAADSFVRFCTDLFSTVLKCIREREGKEGAARARARRQNDDSLPSTRIQKSEIGFGRGRKREIHEYWVRSALLHSPRAPHTGPPAVQPGPAANKIFTKKGTPIDRQSKRPRNGTCASRNRINGGCYSLARKSSFHGVVMPSPS